MNALKNKIVSALSGLVLFVTALVMIALGFATFATLAVFAFFAVIIAVLASPFVGMVEPKSDDVEDAEVIA